MKYRNKVGIILCAICALVSVGCGEQKKNGVEPQVTTESKIQETLKEEQLNSDSEEVTKNEYIDQVDDASTEPTSTIENPYPYVDQKDNPLFSDTNKVEMPDVEIEWDEEEDENLAEETNPETDQTVRPNEDESNPETNPTGPEEKEAEPIVEETISETQPKEEQTTEKEKEEENVGTPEDYIGEDDF